MQLEPFRPFPKIPRLINTRMVISEKIDGTNAQVFIPKVVDAPNYARKVMAGSRNHWLEPGNDNSGFAAWVETNWEELLKLGPGTHYGEWWGSGIQRTYGLKEKRFWLFNTGRWSNPETRPACVGCVPVLYYGQFNQQKIEEVKANLYETGSVAAPGFKNPEGIVIYLPKANILFKSTKEDNHKGAT